MQAWLTPDAPSGVTIRRVLHIPVELLSSVNGALQELTEAYNWEQYGALTPEQTAALCETMLGEYYVDIVGDDIGGRNQVVPPYCPSSFSNGWDWLGSAGSNAGGYWQCADSAPVNNYVEWTLYMPPGSYKVRTVMRAASTCGDYRVTMDGSTIENISAYSASTALNTVFLSIAFSVTGSAAHLLRYTTVGKQPASTGYRLYISAINLEWQP